MTPLAINTIIEIIGFVLLFSLIMFKDRSFQKWKRNKFGRDKIGEYERINQIVHSAPFALNTYVVIDSDNRIVNCNDRAQKMFGWKELELIGKNVKVLFTESSFEVFESFRKTRLLSSDDELIELGGVTKIDTDIPVEVAIGKWTDDVSWYFTVVMRDITHRKRNDETQKKLIEQVIQVKSLYHEGEKIGQVGFWKLDCRTGKIEASPNFYHLFGIKGIDFPVENLIKRVALEDRTMVAEAMSKAKEEKTGYTIQYKFNGLDGYICTFYSMTSAIKNKKGEMTHLIGMSRLLKKENPTWK